jgi:hypothetical protein
VRKLLLLVCVLSLALLSGGVDRVVTSMSPTAATTSDTVTDLPVLRHRDFGANPVPSPAQPAQPASAVAKPAQPAAPALPPGTVAATSTAVEDPCDGFNSMDARERCRENEMQRRERDRARQFQDEHPTPHP